MDSEPPSPGEAPAPLSPDASDATALRDEDWRDTYRHARIAMLVVAVILGIVTLLTLGCFVYQAFFYGGYASTDTGRVAVLGHLIRATVFGAMFVSLVLYLRSIDATGCRSEKFALHHRTFWCLSAAGFCALASFGLFEYWYASSRTLPPIRDLLPKSSPRPVSIDPKRIEFRRGYDEEGGGRVQMQRRGETVFVAPEAAITGEEIEWAKTEITEIFPGRPDVVLHIKMTPEGARKMTTLSRSQMGLPLAVLIDGQLRSAPRVRVEVSDLIQVTGAFTPDEVGELQPEP